jgi:simple sugar transport system ATP-binding protein
MLAPLEANSLFGLLRLFVDQGNSAILVTHKLREVRERTDEVTVLRSGRLVGSGPVEEMDSERMLGLMVGGRKAVSLTGEETPTQPARSPGQHSDIAPSVLEIRGLSVAGRRPLRGIDMSVRGGEVLGVAGVDGSGQTELAEAIMGLRAVRSGSILMDGREIRSLSTSARMERGIAWIPEDRRREGLVLSFSVAENLLLGRQRQKRFGGGRMLKPRWIEEIGRSTIERFRIKASEPGAAVESLSGGHQQKVVVARALSGEPRLLVALQPTRGLDVESTQFVIREIRSQARHGVGVLYFSLDLDELLEVSDRIAVMFNGQVVGVLPRSEADSERIGRLMMSGSA